MTAALWWIRRDLRLSGNVALQRCLAHSGSVIPVFVLDPAILGSASHQAATQRSAFLFEGLRALNETLRSRRGRLIVRWGAPQTVLRDLAADTGADVIWAEEDFSPYARRRDEEVGQKLPLHLAPGLSIHHPRSVVKKDGSPYTMFSAYSRAWRALPFPPAGDGATPAALNTPESLDSLPLPDTPAGSTPPPTETEARRRLELFLKTRMVDYKTSRNRLDQEGTSSLSPYFRFGMLPVREAAAAARTYEQAPGPQAGGASCWLSELIWRDFYFSVLFHFPHVVYREFDPALRDLPWRNDDAALEAWQYGRTGYPVVDAGMRQLLATGWMHNRARMITASFLVKDLLIDWREGESWFMRHLIDGDRAANNGGWQWTAGVGTGAAPYFRIFNPVTQGERFDPSGGYVRQWVPELARMPGRWIHRPWQAPAPELKAAGIQLGRTYPRPIVDHTRARARALEVFARAKRST